MIRVVDLRFGGLSMANLRIFRSAGLRTGWSHLVCIFFFKWEPDAPHPVHNFKKRKRGYLYNFMKGSRGKKIIWGCRKRVWGWRKNLSEQIIFLLNVKPLLSFGWLGYTSCLHEPLKNNWIYILLNSRGLTCSCEKKKSRCVTCDMVYSSLKLMKSWRGNSTFEWANSR